jgi:uncharacterized protein YhhL (DUF1145 family)
MTVKNLYLILAIIGTACTVVLYAPVLAAHSWNPMAFMHSLLNTPISTGMTINVIMASLSLIVLNHTEGRKLGIKTWIPTMAISLFGIACGLPVYLYLREKAKEKQSSQLR